MTGVQTCALPIYGKLVDYQSFYDSFDMLEQVIGQHLDVPESYPHGSEPAA